MSERYDIPDDLYYTKDHEWVRIERKMGVVGITDYAQKKLREIIYVELPNVNTKVKQKETIATIESVKATSDVYSPISGKIVEVNIRLADNPELINESPYEDGWIAKIEISDEKELDNLMEPDEYRRYIESLEEEE